MTATIKVRHMMAATYGVPVTIDDAKIEALAIVWVDFQEQFPTLSMSPKARAVFNLVAASTVTYLPVAGSMLTGLRSRRAPPPRPTAVNQPGPPMQATPTPGPPPGPSETAGMDPTARGSLNGGEVIISQGGSVNGGRLRFE